MRQEDFTRPSGRLVAIEDGCCAFVPDPLPPEIAWSGALVRALSDADRALGELSGLGRTIANPYLLIRPFLRREAVLSSRIEGTQSSISDLYAYEAGQLALFDLPSDVLEVANYVRALEHGLARLAQIPISVQLIRELHQLLLEGGRGGSRRPGQFRTTQNYIGEPGSRLAEASFVPPPALEVEPALRNLETYLAQPSDLPPLVRIGLAHYQFEAIHPFIDGNGRVGRLLIILLLCEWKLLPSPLLYLSAYFEARRNAYVDLLRAISERSAWDEWLHFFLLGVTSQARDAVARARRLVDLRERYRNQLQVRKTSARSLSVLDLVFERAVVSIPQVANALELDYLTAQRHVQQLVEASLLREASGNKRNRIYVAHELLRAIDEPLSPAQDFA